MSDAIEQVKLTQLQDFQFEIDFGHGIAPLHSDEPSPIGQGTGPSPVQLLAAAVGNCLSNSLSFALRKFKQRPEPIRTEVTAEVGRNDQGRQRVLALKVTLRLGVPAAQLEHLDRVLGSFENFCTVTQSVSPGIAVQVGVLDREGQVLKAPATLG